MKKQTLRSTGLVDAIDSRKGPEMEPFDDKDFARRQAKINARAARLAQRKVQPTQVKTQVLKHEYVESVLMSNKKNWQPRESQTLKHSPTCHHPTCAARRGE